MHDQDIHNELLEDTQTDNKRRVSKSRLSLRIIGGFLAAILLFFVMRWVLNPFGDKDYAEIPHGDHSHFVPKDRDPNIPISNFPRTPPAPNEKITPDGRIVPKIEGD
ncbi:MAG: hypothetical protein OXF08_07045 [Bacteroidetes bacterium]|nr:hypothetical protein [Bacteroidota bacterium]